MNDDKPEDLVTQVKEFIYSKYRAERKVPPVAMVAEKFGISNYRVIEIFRILAHMGFLKRNFSRYGMGAEKGPVGTEGPAAPPPVIGPQVSPPTVKEVEAKAELESGHSMNAISPAMLMAIRVVLGLIALGAIALSVYYTSIWLIRYLPGFLAVVLATIMVTFSCLAFETVIILRRNGQWFMMTMFAVLWAIVLVFSMSSTVAGQYNQRIKSQNVTVEANSDTTQARLGYDLLLKQEKQIEKQIADKAAQRAVFQKLLDTFDTVEKQKADAKVFADTSKKIDLIDKDLKDLNAQLLAKQEEQRKYLTTAKGPGAVQETTAEVPSFYNWIHEVLGLSAAMTEFWMSVFPAIFIDLIAPFSLAITIFVRSVGTPTKRKRSLAWLEKLLHGGLK